MRSWSLGHLTVNGALPWELVEIAARAGYDMVDPIVGLVDMPGLQMKRLEAGDADTLRMARVLKDTGLQFNCADGFIITADTDLDQVDRMIELVAGMGARSVNGLPFGEDRNAAVAKFAAFDALARTAGLPTVTEPTPLSLMADSAQSLAMIAEIGSDNIRLMMDPLHYFYAGGKAEDLPELTPHIGAAQLCDARAVLTWDEYRHTALDERIAPGEGELPVRAYMAAIPPDIPCAVEVPRTDEPDWTKRARRVLEAAKKVDTPAL